MKWIYIADSDRSSDIDRDSVIVRSQLKRRSSQARLTMFDGGRPNEYDDVKVYDGALVESHGGTTITLRKSYEEGVGTFRAGQVIWLRIGETDAERAVIDSYDEATRTIELTESPDASMGQNDRVGELVFGGVVGNVTDSNPKTLDEINYSVDAMGYDRLLDAKIISETFEDEDGRHIINSLLISDVNVNETVDSMDYDNATAIRAAWTESGDGDNPNIDGADYIEGDASGVLPWTNSGGTATFEATPAANDVSELTGAASGQPTEGMLSVDLQTEDQADITAFRIRIGSSAGHYAEVEFEVGEGDDFSQLVMDLDTASVTGTPDWTALDYVAVIITETGDGQVKLNGIRILKKGSFTRKNFEPTPTFDDFRIAQKKPLQILDDMASALERVWYVDFERDIHFSAVAVEDAPIALTEDSDNFDGLKVGVDATTVGNRIIVNGGYKKSDSFYSQVLGGDGHTREWILKNKFGDLSLLKDDGSVTDAAEAGTTTTNVTATAHGLVTGDYMVNRTRDDAVRRVTKVDDDNFTVDAVTAQESGDTFSKFAAVTDGVEGLTDETTVDYVANSNEKSVRATDSEATLNAGDFLLATYRERIRVQYRHTDPSSVARLKALGIGDGIKDLDPLTDRNIEDTQSAALMAQAKVRQFSNAIISGSFRTDRKGFRAGQIVRITDSNRGISDDYLVQGVRTVYAKGAYGDYATTAVSFGTTIFGWVELMQKLLADSDRLEQATEDVVQDIIESLEDMTMGDATTVTLGGIDSVGEDEDMTLGDSNAVGLTAPPWKYEPNGVGQAFKSRYGLAEYG